MFDIFSYQRNQESRGGLLPHSQCPSILQQHSCCGLQFLSAPISSRSPISSPTLFLHHPIPLPYLPISGVAAWKLMASLVRELGTVSTLSFLSSSFSYSVFFQLRSRPPDMISSSSFPPFPGVYKDPESIFCLSSSCGPSQLPSSKPSIFLSISS